MTTYDKKVIIASFVIVQLSFFSYVNFLAFKPKILRQLAEVKGAKTEAATNLPYPQKYTKISSDTTLKGKTVTLEVAQPAKDIQTFYNNVLSADGWKVESESDSNMTTQVKYKKSGKFVTITTASEGAEIATILSIEISN